MPVVRMYSEAEKERNVNKVGRSKNKYLGDVYCPIRCRCGN